MSKEQFDQALQRRRPYFGPYMSCRKSWPHIYWYQQKLVKFLSTSTNWDDLRILEIGSWAGASTFSWCHAISRYFRHRGGVVCVDIWNDEIQPKAFRVASDQPLITDVFLHNIAMGAYSNLVLPIRATSDQAFMHLRDTMFNIIYLDGDHSYQQVSRDIYNSLNLLDLGSILCGDDLEVQAHQVDNSILKRSSNADDSWMINPTTSEGFHPGVTRAVAEQIGPVSAWNGFWAVKKEEHGWSNLNLDSIEAPIPRPLMQYNNDGTKEFDL